jgi:MFS family permease
LQSFALAALAISGRITVWDILWLSVFQGLINAFDMPARQAFVIEMVEDRRDLSNAIALNSSMVNVARLLGPSMAGMLIAAVGEGYCFLIDGISYLSVIASLLMMQVAGPRVVRKKKNTLVELKEGWDYVSGFAPIRSILLLLALISLMGMPYSVLMPIFAAGILHGGAHTLGFLMGAVGIGALIGAYRLAVRRSVLGLGRLIAISAALFGAGLVAFSQSHWLWLSLVLMFFVGLGMMQELASSNTIIQTILEEDKRGRVMSYYAMAFTGMAPFGSLLAGTLASRLGAQNALLITGASCIAGAIWFAAKLPDIRRVVRPIYIELGIIPQMAKGIQHASAQEEAAR